MRIMATKINENTHALDREVTGASFDGEVGLLVWRDVVDDVLTD